TSRACCERIVCALALLVGCRQIVGFEERRPDDGGASPAGETALPRLPFAVESDYREGCERCGAESCRGEREACLADDDCRELLRCRAGCSDPVCLARCGSFDHRDFALGPIFSQARGGENYAFYRYLGCMALANCSSECGWGTNWSCLGSKKYRWPHFPDKL